MIKKAYTYDDIQLIPDGSDIDSRNDIDLTTKLSKNYTLDTPIIASPMDTICGADMAIMLANLGGVGCIHRFQSTEEQVQEIRKINTHLSLSDSFDDKTPRMAAIGIKYEDKIRAKELVKNGANVILIDVAHGHHQKVGDMVEWLKDKLPDHVDVVAGNISTIKAAEYLQRCGADGLRIGQGGGSLCTTRIQTGFGVPMVTAIQDVSSVSDVPVIADGGIRTAGDIAKALAVGANTVMLGSLLSGTKETPGAVIDKNGVLYKRYRGSASLETKLANGQENRNIEGESTIVPFKGGVRFVIHNLMDGLRSALSYAGASNLNEYNPDWNIITNSGVVEAKPHLL